VVTQVTEEYTMANLGSLIAAAIHAIPPSPIDQVHDNFGTAVSTYVHDLNSIPGDPCFGVVVNEAVLGITHPTTTDFFLL
jgi:hypothetical protein